MLAIPKFKIQGFEYIDEETKKYKLKENAPQWAKDEFKEYIKNLQDMTKERKKLYEEKGIIITPSYEYIEEVLSQYI